MKTSELPRIDVLNLQGIGPQDKGWLVMIFQYLNSLYPEEDLYELVIADEATDKSNLRVATIYRSSRLSLIRNEPLLVEKYNDIFTQFGLYLTFMFKKENETTIDINVANVHMEKGQTTKDSEIRQR